MTPRQIALRILYKVNEEQAFSNVALENELAVNRPKDRRDVGLITEIVNGTIKNKLYLDFVISRFSKEKIEKMSPWVRNILRMSVYQLLFLDKIPESAAVNEGVNLTKKYSHQGSVRFVNAVLRNVIRKKGEWELPDPLAHPVEYLSLKYSFPAWLIEHFISLYGREQTEKLVSWFNQVPPLWIRRNALKITQQDFETQLADVGYQYKRSPFVSEGYLLTERSPVAQSDLYRQGWLSLQDETSMFAVDILDPLPGESILDTCSAPGGKTLFMAERMKNQGTILAADLYPQRTAIVSENAKRTGADIVTTETIDASALDQKYQQVFDKILIDAPCSGLGVLGRRPDLKYHASECKFEEITAIQRAILQSAAKLLKPGGRLVYATCTLNPQENQEMAEFFLQTHPDFEKEPITKYEAYTDEHGYLQTLPFRDGKSGFFIAKFKKRGTP